MNPRALRAVARASRRYHLQHRWQLGLSLLGIALGVAVVVAVDVAAGSARRALELSSEAISGRATHEILGGPAGLPDSVFALVRISAGVDSAAPVVDRYVRAGGPDGPVMRLIGVDPFSDAPFRGYTAMASGVADANVGVLLTGRTVLLAAGAAVRLDTPPGDSLVLIAGTRRSTVRVAGSAVPADAAAARALDDVILTDIATAQEVTGALGRLDRIELRVSRDTAATLAAVRAALPPGARVAETALRTGATSRLTRAFETNLTALALVALVFGMFLIYNSVTFSLVQRRPLIGLLRVQGVSRRELGTVLLGEAVVLGAVATVVGLGAGQLLGTALVRLVATTVNDLYFAVTVQQVKLPLLAFVKAGIAGVGGTLLAALLPVREALGVRPRATLSRSDLERRTRTGAGRLLLPGLACAVAAGVLLATPSRSVLLGFAGLFVLILAAALLVPVCTLALMRIARPLAGVFGPLGRLAVGGVSASLSRTAPAIAALAVSLAVGIAVTAMIGSFRDGVAAWLGRALPADVYVSAPDFAAGRNDALLDPSLAPQLAGLPGVAGISTYRHATLLVDGDFATFIAVRLDPRHTRAFEVLRGDGDVDAALDRGELLVSEPFAYRRGMEPGDSVTLPTDRGPVPFRIAAVYRDYASEHGVIFMHRDVFDRYWQDRGVTSVAVFAGEGVPADSILGRARQLPAARGALLRSNSGLRATSLEVFDRTFAITGVLRILALLVAFVGVTGALMALQLERAREIAVLRTAGVTPAQVWRLITGQTALMGIVSATLAVPLGAAMAWAMVHVINRRSFGWSFDLLLAPTPFLEAFATGLLAAVLAGAWPAWRMARVRPAVALREE